MKKKLIFGTGSGLEKGLKYIKKSRYSCVY